MARNAFSPEELNLGQLAPPVPQPSIRPVVLAYPMS